MEQSAKHSEREWLRKQEKHNKDRQNLCVGSKNYTCFINIVNIDMQFKGYVLVIKSRLKADFLLFEVLNTFCLQSFCRLICNMSISLRRSVNE